MHSYDNEPVSTRPHVLPRFLSITYSTHRYTDKGQSMLTNLLYTDTHTHAQSHTNLHAKSQTPQCLVENGLIVSSPRRPALSRRLAETDRHLAFRTPQSFQAVYTGFFNEEREGEISQMDTC